MTRAIRLALIAAVAVAGPSKGQDALSGFEMPITVAGAGFSSHILSKPEGADSNTAAGFRALTYPTLRLNEKWFFSGVVQLRSRPYFFEEFGRGNSGFEVDTLQAYAGYERFWGGKYVTVKAGLLPAAFGSFSLRYDDAVNPMIGLPAGYGYYASPVTTLGLSGAQVDVGNGRADARVQFTSSSPANPRGITEDGQYGTWTTGFGVSPVQGLRIGTSGYRGPYLHDNHRFNRPGEIHSRALPATAAGLDVQFARGHWYFNGELNRLRLPYTAIPNLNRTMAWAEAKYVPHPRWYLAGRLNHSSSNLIPTRDVCELAVGYRPNRRQIIKVGYQAVRGPRTRGTLDNVLAIQFVLKLRGPAMAFERGGWHSVATE